MPDDASGAGRDERSRPDRAREPVAPADSELVALVADGDRTALGDLYDRYATRTYSLARRICGSSALAEDAVQDSFLALWRNPGRFDPSKGSFSTWLMTLVHHRAVDAVRKEATHQARVQRVAETAEVANPGNSAGADIEALAKVESRTVHEALEQLPEHQQTIIRLAYLGGYTQSEVAAATGLPLGTVKSRTFAGLRKLRAALASSHALETSPHGRR